MWYSTVCLAPAFTSCLAHIKDTNCAHLSTYTFLCSRLFSANSICLSLLLIFLQFQTCDKTPLNVPTSCPYSLPLLQRAMPSFISLQNPFPSPPHLQGSRIEPKYCSPPEQSLSSFAKKTALTAHIEVFIKVLRDPGLYIDLFTARVKIAECCSLIASELIDNIQTKLWPWFSRPFSYSSFATTFSALHLTTLRCSLCCIFQ